MKILQASLMNSLLVALLQNTKYCIVIFALTIDQVQTVFELFITTVFMWIFIKTHLFYVIEFLKFIKIFIKEIKNEDWRNKI